MDIIEAQKLIDDLLKEYNTLNTIKVLFRICDECNTLEPLKKTLNDNFYHEMRAMKKAMRKSIDLKYEVGSEEFYNDIINMISLDVLREKKLKEIGIK